MAKLNRRRMLAGSLALTAIGVSSATPADTPKPRLGHHVFFWLANPDSKDDRDALIAGLRTLGEIPSVKDIRIGVPARTEKRDVVDNSFSVSELLFFDDLAAQALYQEHPVHKAFVENHAHLWSRVVVYDVMESV